MDSNKAYNKVFNSNKNRVATTNFFSRRGWISKALKRIEKANIKFIEDEFMLDKYDVLKQLEYNIKHKTRIKKDVQKYANLIGGSED